jgi:spore photoproduct lyase
LGFIVFNGSFERRLQAARKLQDAGYRIRIRLDPIVPIPDWETAYGDTIRRIFEKVNPESVTMGTLRFEEGFHKMRNTFFQSQELVNIVNGMVPMFLPKLFPGTKRPKSGKYSFLEGKRAEIFSYAIG